MAKKRLPLEIFTYSDYRQFLAALYECWGNVVRKWSYSYFSREAGFSSPNYLRLIIEGKKNLSESSIKKITTFFQFNKQESDYFRELVFMNQAKSDDEREKHYKKIAKMPAYKAIRADEKHLHEFYSKWYNPVIRELVEVKAFQNDPKWISSVLLPSVSEKEAESARNMLLKSGQLVEDEDGKLVQREPVVSTGAEVASLAVSNYHREMLDRAKSALEFPSDARNISSLTMAVSREMYEKLVAEIYSFQDKVIAMLGDDTPAEEVVQLNFQLFPVTDVAERGGSHE